MPYDALLGITGPANAPGNPVEAAAITADALGTKGYVWVGKYRVGRVEVRLAGAFDRADGNETLQVVVREATDAAGTGAAAIATSAVLIASMAPTTAALGTGPSSVGFATGSGGFIAVFFDVSGTTPSAAGVSCDIVMAASAIQQSGR